MGFRTHSLRERTTRALRPSGRTTRLRDRFELLVPLGSGGFGTVWEGFDMLLERPVAVKELRIDQELTDTGDALREARATARLNHPAIVSLYEIVSEDDCIYMINELVHGHTLAAMIDEGLMSDNDAGRIGYALCEALAPRARPGRDPPRRQARQRDGHEAWLEGSGGWRVQPAKLMDFGIASIVDPGEHGGARTPGRTLVRAATSRPSRRPASRAPRERRLFAGVWCCSSASPDRGPRKGRRSRLATRASRSAVSS